MKRNSITSRLSLRAKFKDSHTVEVCVMNELNEILIFILPIDFKSSKNLGKIQQESSNEVEEEVNSNDSNSIEE